ncbi:hypothetical protein ACFYXQ_03925 [Nocardia jiangxiensis]|uniref:IrrE N-terminal-like domain-containing protein n=1 Tax=Nocardia jiangxiensis TaxID=282685 RepID=A0ABW6RSC9_9NOCA
MADIPYGISGGAIGARLKRHRDFLAWNDAVAAGVPARLKPDGIGSTEPEFDPHEIIRNYSGFGSERVHRYAREVAVSRALTRRAATADAWMQTKDEVLGISPGEARTSAIKARDCVRGTEYDDCLFDCFSNRGGEAGLLGYTREWVRLMDAGRARWSGQSRDRAAARRFLGAYLEQTRTKYLAALAAWRGERRVERLGDLLDCVRFGGAGRIDAGDVARATDLPICGVPVGRVLSAIGAVIVFRPGFGSSSIVLDLPGPVIILLGSQSRSTLCRDLFHETGHALQTFVLGERKNPSVADYFPDSVIAESWSHLLEVIPDRAAACGDAGFDIDGGRDLRSLVETRTYATRALYALSVDAANDSATVLSDSCAAVFREHLDVRPPPIDFALDIQHGERNHERVRALLDAVELEARCERALGADWWRVEGALSWIRAAMLADLTAGPRPEVSDIDDAATSIEAFAGKGCHARCR